MVGAVLVATGVGVVLARRGSDEGGSVTEPASEPIAETGWLSGCADIGPIVAPGRLAAGSLGPAPTPSLAPPSRPSGPVWPTNQWWTSIFSRPNEPLWSFPIATRFSPDGIALSVSDPVASANAVVTPPSPSTPVPQHRKSSPSVTSMS